MVEDQLRIEKFWPFFPNKNKFRCFCHHKKLMNYFIKASFAPNKPEITCFASQDIFQNGLLQTTTALFLLNVAGFSFHYSPIRLVSSLGLMITCFLDLFEHERRKRILYNIYNPFTNATTI